MLEMTKKHDRYKALCRQVFNTADGKELMSHFEELFVDCRLWSEEARATDYAVAQRDLIMEIKDHAGLLTTVEIEEEQNAIN